MSDIKSEIDESIAAEKREYILSYLYAAHAFAVVILGFMIIIWGPQFGLFLFQLHHCLEFQLSPALSGYGVAWGQSMAWSRVKVSCGR